MDSVNTTINECINYINTKINPLLISNGHIELEIQVYFPMPYEMAKLGGLCYTNNIHMNIDQYVEIVYRYNNDNYMKHRYRKSIDDIKTLQLIPLSLIEKIKSNQCNTKIKLSEHIIKPLSINISEEIDSKETVTDTTIYDLYYVQRTSFNVRGWILDFKYKYKLKYDSMLCSAIISNANAPLYSVEIEFEQDFRKLTNNDLLNLRTVIGQLFVTKLPLEKLYWTLDPTPMKHIFLNTLSINHQTLFGTKYLSYYVTPKIDGSNILFMNKNNIFYILTPEQEIVFSYDSNSNEEFYGRLEMIDNTLIPFFVYFPTLVEKSRLEHINYLETLNLEVESYDIMFKPFIGPFNTLEDYCSAIKTQLSYKRYKIDGVVIFDGDTILNNNDKVKINDYKYKIDNTVDLIAVCVMNDMSYLSMTPFSKRVNEKLRLMFNLYTQSKKDGKLVIKRIGSSELFVNNNIFMLNLSKNYFVTNIQDKAYLHFHKLIMECSISTTKTNEFTLIKPRFDKTRKYLSITASSNDESLINLNRDINNTSIGIFVLEQLSILFDPNLIAPKLITIEEDTSKVIINQDYFYISSKCELLTINNHIKTQIINTTISNYLVSFYPPHKPPTTLLMIDAGEGDDLKTYKYVIKNVVITDIDSNIVEIAVRTANHLKMKYNYKIISMISKEYGNEVKRVCPIYDVIDWQLSIQYSWHPDYYDIVMRNIKIVSNFGTKLIITCHDGLRLRELINESNTLFEISTSNIKLTYIDNIKYKYNNLEEFYVDKDLLLTYLYNIGYECIVTDTFDELLKSNIVIPSMKLIYNKVLDKQLYKYYSTLRYYIFISK